MIARTIGIVSDNARGAVAHVAFAGIWCCVNTVEAVRHGPGRVREAGLAHWNGAVERVKIMDRAWTRVVVAKMPEHMGRYIHRLDLLPREVRMKYRLCGEWRVFANIMLFFCWGVMVKGMLYRFAFDGTSRQMKGECAIAGLLVCWIIQKAAYLIQIKIELDVAQARTRVLVF